MKLTLNWFSWSSEICWLDETGQKVVYTWETNSSTYRLLGILLKFLHTLFQLQLFCFNFLRIYANSDVKVKSLKNYVLRIFLWPNIEYGQRKECKWLKVQDYLEVSIIHLPSNIFSCTNFCNAGAWIFRVGLFMQMKKILSQNTPKNLNPYFEFVFMCNLFLQKNLKICKTADLQISAPVLVHKTVLVHKQFTSPLPYY